MTDKEKLDAIRAEIHRLVDVRGYDREMANDLFAFMDSLPNEPVSDIDFEQELYKAFGQVKDFTLGMRIAKRFYEMGKNHQEPVSKDLEKAAVEAFKQIVDSDKNNFLEIFKAGTQWQKQQMIANTIDGKVIANGMGNPILHLWDKGIHLIDKKVKVIVINEEEV